MTALLLIPMMVFTAFATDVGAWYVRGQEIQRAADAAALAAVVWMPNEDKAAEVAFDVAARNGFVDKAGDVPADGDLTDLELPQVRVTQVGAQMVRVDIWAEGDLYFGSVIDSFDKPQIQRFATAEYVLPVPMGNPTSALGTANDTAYGNVANFFLVSNGPCDDRINGDLISTRGSDRCEDTDGATAPNPMYDPAGHAFIVDVPADPTNPLLPADTWELQIRMTCYDPTNNRMEVTVFPADDTPLNDYDNEDLAPIRAATTYTAHDCTGWNKIVNPATGTGDSAVWEDVITFTEPGRHIVRLRNPSNDASDAVNWGQYSLRVKDTAVADNARWACSRIASSEPLVTVTPLCPNIYAREFMSVTTFSSMLPDDADTATLYLAEISEVHKGKTLEITLFDVADGIDFVQVLGPDGVAVPLTWRSIDNEQGYGTTIGLVDQGPIGPQYCITPSGSSEPCLTGSGVGFTMQDRTIVMEIPLDSGYSCVDDGTNPVDCWWKVRYVDDDNDIGENTTWNVRVIGDPVRLVE